MFMVGPQLGSFVQIRPEIILDLDKIYRRTRKKELAAAKAARIEAEKYVKQLGEAAAKAASEADRQTTPVDEEHPPSSSTDEANTWT
jgi:hypothetical protein